MQISSLTYLWNTTVRGNLHIHNIKFIFEKNCRTRSFILIQCVVFFFFLKNTMSVYCGFPLSKPSIVNIVNIHMRYGTVTLHTQGCFHCTSPKTLLPHAWLFQELGRLLQSFRTQTGIGARAVHGICQPKHHLKRG